MQTSKKHSLSSFLDTVSVIFSTKVGECFFRIDSCLLLPKVVEGRGDFGREEVFKSTEPWPFKIHSWEKKRARERKRRRRATEDEKKNWREAEGRREGERLVDIMHGIPSLSSPVLAFLAVGKKLFHSAYWKSSMYIIADATVAAQAPG